MSEYSQGIMGDGPVILKDGKPMKPEEIVNKLNEKYQLKATEKSECTHSQYIVKDGFRCCCYCGHKQPHW